MKNISLKIFMLIIIFSYHSLAQNIDIYLTPLVSTTSYNNINFKEKLNYGYHNINKKTLKPELKFGYDIKPGININAKFQFFFIGATFYISNSFAGPRPLAQQFNGNGTEAHNFTLGENHTLEKKGLTELRLVNNEHKIYFGYFPYKNLYINVHLLNYVLDIDKANYAVRSYSDSVNLSFLEKISSLGIEIGYKKNISKILKISLNSSIDYIYNFNEISYKPSTQIEEGKYIKHRYNGYSYSLGIKFNLKNIFLCYQFLQMQTEKNYFSNSFHKFEIGISLEALSIDINKLFRN